MPVALESQITRNDEPPSPDDWETRACIGLWAAVIERAGADLCGFDISTEKGQKQANMRLARRWILSEKNDVGSFCWACEAVGYDFEKVKQKLLEANKRFFQRACRAAKAHRLRSLQQLGRRNLKKRRA